MGSPLIKPLPGIQGHNIALAKRLLVGVYKLVEQVSGLHILHCDIWLQVSGNARC